MAKNGHFAEMATAIGIKVGGQSAELLAILVLVV